ncbi:MAG: GntR family transcriptional regulator [Vampirovibrio sp.]
MSKTPQQPTETLSLHMAVNGTQNMRPATRQVKGAFSSTRLLHEQVLENTATLQAPIRLSVNELPEAFSLSMGVGKDTQIAEWLSAWIQAGFEQATLHESHLLPLKKDLADYLGVSIGTVQNAIRFVEDEGWVESKQRIGTLLRNASDTQEVSRIRKQTSKRDQAVLAIQQYIVSAGFQVNDILPSSREMAKTIDSAPNTTRLAMEFLANEGLLEAMGNRGKKPNWTLKRLPSIEHVGKVFAPIESYTLIDQVERDLKALISDHYEVNDTLPSHQELATSFKVSIKTVHDAMQRLAEQGMTHAKRGRYGTYVTRLPLYTTPLSDIEHFFIPVEQHIEAYDYEKAYQSLHAKLSNEFQSGEQLPSVQALSDEIGVTVNSIRRGLKQLESEKRVTFKRGRYGGTIVL